MIGKDSLSFSFYSVSCAISLRLLDEKKWLTYKVIVLSRMIAEKITAKEEENTKAIRETKQRIFGALVSICYIPYPELLWEVVNLNYYTEELIRHFPLEHRDEIEQSEHFKSLLNMFK